jgi:hypothetical protein
MLVALLLMLLGSSAARGQILTFKCTCYLLIWCSSAEELYFAGNASFRDRTQVTSRRKDAGSLGARAE